jgi:ribonuclease HI
MEEKPFVRFTLIDIKDGRSMKFRISKIVSTLTAEALAIGETLEIIERIDSEQNFMIFSDSASVLKGISNFSTMNNTSHITQMLKDKIERLELQGKIIQFYWIPGHCRIEVNERADLEAKQAIKEG